MAATQLLKHFTESGMSLAKLGNQSRVLSVGHMADGGIKRKLEALLRNVEGTRNLIDPICVGAAVA